MSWILKALGEWMMGKALAVVFSVGTSDSRVQYYNPDT
jgi:hypothetical protein